MIIVELYAQNGTCEQLSNCRHNNANPRPSQNYQQEVHIPVNVIIILNYSFLHAYFFQEYSEYRVLNPSTNEFLCTF